MSMQYIGNENSQITINYLLLGKIMREEGRERSFANIQEGEIILKGKKKGDVPWLITKNKWGMANLAIPHLSTLSDTK